MSIPQAITIRNWSNVTDQTHAVFVSHGDVPDTPGWIPGAPPLAVEYADTGPCPPSPPDQAPPGPPDAGAHTPPWRAWMP